MTYQEIMSLRSAYNQGIRTPETRQACAEYMELRKQEIEAGRHISELSKTPEIIHIPYPEMMKLRSQYQLGVRNPQTRNAARLYAAIRRGAFTTDNLLQETCS